MSRFAKIALAGGLAGLLLLINVQHVSASEPRTGGTLRLPLTGDIPTLDPARCYELPGELFVRIIYQSLIDFDDGVNLVPVLAKSWSMSSDGLVYSFELDPKARFSNGRAVEAADYLFSFERMLSPKMHSPADFMYFGIRGVADYRAGKAVHIEGIAAPAPHKLTFTLTKPDLTFLFRLSMPFAAPVCAEQLKSKLTEIGTASAGAGPYKLKKWVRGARLELDRNRYYGGSDPGFIDVIDATIGIDDAVGQMMFERDQLDIANIKTGMTGAEYPRVQRTPALSTNLDSVISSQIDYLSLNTEIAPFDNKLVRKAVNYAINKQRLVEISGERIVASHGVLPPIVPGYDAKRKGYEYSPAKARELLVQAGFADGFTTTVIFPNVIQDSFRIIAAIQEDLRQVGITLNATPVSWAAYLEKSQRRKTAAVCYAAWFEDYPDPSNYLDVMLDGELITERDCQNLAFYNNPKVNVLLKTAATSLIAEERLHLYRRAEDLIVDDAPWVFLDSAKQFCLHQPWLKNTKPHVVWPFRFEKMWFDQ